MFDIFSASGFFVHTPCGPRKSGMPESVEMRAHEEEQPVAEREAARRDGPAYLTAQAIREVAERDLAGDAHEGHEAERERRRLRIEPDVDQVARLVDLHRVPRPQAREERDG